MNRNRKTKGILICALVATGILLVDGRSAKADFVFGEAENPGPPINTSDADGTTYISPDGLTLYFSSDRPGGYGQYDLWVATRPTRGDDWGHACESWPYCQCFG